MNTDPEIEAIVMKNAQLYPNCAQTSFLSMQQRNKLDCDVPRFLQAITALPGVGRTGETCGAVSGPILAIGLALAPKDHRDQVQTAKCHAAAQQLCTAVEKEFGSTRCGDIIEHCCGTRYDLNDPEQAKQYVAAGGLKECLNVVQTAVTIATGILEDAKKGAAVQVH